MLKQYAKEPISKGKKQFFGIRKWFYRIENKQLKVREVKIKTEIQEFFFKPIIVSADDMDKFEEKEMKKILPYTW